MSRTRQAVAGVLWLACAILLQLILAVGSPAFAQSDEFNSNSGSSSVTQGSGSSGIPPACSGPGGCPGSYFNSLPTGTQTYNPSNTGCGNPYGCPNTTGPTGTQAVPAPTLQGGVKTTAPLQGSVQQTAPLQGSVQQQAPATGSVQQATPATPLPGSAKKSAPLVGSVPSTAGQVRARQGAVPTLGVPTHNYPTANVPLHNYPTANVPLHNYPTANVPSRGYPSVGNRYPQYQHWQQQGGKRNQFPAYGGRVYNAPAHSGIGLQNLPGVLNALPGIAGTINNFVSGIARRITGGQPPASQYQSYPSSPPYYSGRQPAYAAPPPPQYQESPTAHPRTYVQRGIARQPEVLDVPIPPQGSLFVPGLQNAANVVNFLSTYHPLETFYTGLAIAGGQLAEIGIVPSEVAVTDVVGGKLYKLNAKALNPRNPLDASANPKLPDLKLLDRPVARNAAQNAIKEKDLEVLRGMGVTEVRVDQQQLAIVKGKLTRVGINRPDVQFTFKGRRYYIEYDTANSTRGVDHALRILANDPNGIVILVTAP